MGGVVAAVDPELGRRVAIKLLRRGIDAGGRLRREGQALARVSHPHVIQIFDVGTHEGRLYITMELVDGGTLRTWAKEGRSWPEVRASARRARARAEAGGELEVTRRELLALHDELEGDESEGAKALRRRVQRWLDRHPAP